jgi:hypothetical protein
MTVDIWIRDYNPPRCFQKKISGRSKHNGSAFLIQITARKSNAKWDPEYIQSKNNATMYKDQIS